MASIRIGVAIGRRNPAIIHDAAHVIWRKVESCKEDVKDIQIENRKKWRTIPNFVIVWSWRRQNAKSIEWFDGTLALIIRVFWDFVR